MHSNVRQISFLACLLLVLVRVSIGWQFLYEGLWKFGTLQTSRPWSAEGYLKNAQGPFRDTFRNMTGDPDDLGKLDYDKVAASWDDFYARFVALHPDLSDDQKRQLDLAIDGPQAFYAPLQAVPEGVDLPAYAAKMRVPKGSFLRYNEKAKRLETNVHLLPSERDALLKLKIVAEDAADKAKSEAAAWQAAVNQLYKTTSKLSFKERLQVLLKEDPDRVGVFNEAHKGTVDEHRPGDIEIYKELLARYNANLKNVKQSFQQEHLAKQWAEIQEKRAALVGPVNALTTELHELAIKLLKPEQFAVGVLPEVPSQIGQINKATMWSLVILGGALIIGLFSRLAAFAAAGLLLLFYLPMPPWPGVPEAPGPEHSFLVNKNLIECIACLALAALPTGRWIGVDALIRRVFLGRKTD